MTENAPKKERTVADDAFDWAASERKAAELDKRLLAFTFDVGLMNDMLEKLFARLNNDDKNWVEGIPNIFDQMFDLQIQLRNMLSRPVGTIAENEFLSAAIDRMQRNDATDTEMERIDIEVQMILKKANKQVLQDFGEWSKQHTNLSYKDRRAQHRQQVMVEYPALFAKIILNKLGPEEAEKFGEEAKQLMKIMAKQSQILDS